MFIDYLALMLVNLSAGLVILALFVFRYLDEDRKKVAPGLLLVGFIATVTGLHVIFTWPLPGSFNIVFGEVSVLFGALTFFGGVALIREWHLLTLGIFAFFAGVVAIIVGIRVANLGLTKSPAMTAVGYILTGAAGVLALPLSFLSRSKVLRLFAALVLVAAAVVFAITGFGAYWDHPASFAGWKPLPTR